MDGTTTMQSTEQEVQATATETQGQQTAESTPEKVSALQKFINGLFGGGKEADGAEPEKKEDRLIMERVFLHGFVFLLRKDYHIEGISRNSNLTNKLNADTFDEVIIRNY